MKLFSASLFAALLAFAIPAVAQEKPAPNGAAPKKEKKEAAKGPGEAELKKRLAETRKKLADVRRKIDADHTLWEKSEKDLETSRARMAELKAALENEKVRHKQLLAAIARIEKEHNGDHDAEEALQKELKEREEALAVFESKQDEITKLEKKAAALRREAEQLRKRAEELKKN